MLSVNFWKGMSYALGHLSIVDSNSWIFYVIETMGIVYKHDNMRINKIHITCAVITSAMIFESIGKKRYNT